MIEQTIKITPEMRVHLMHAQTLTIEFPEDISALKEDIAELKIALHDAIRRPLGVVPASAEKFYNK